MDKSELLKQLRIDRDAGAEVAGPRSRLWIAMAAFLALVVTAAAWLLMREEALEVSTEPARAVVSAANGGSASVLDATGYVTARRQATVSAKITGKVRDVRIEEGQQVREGDVLATLDDAEARAEAGLRRAQVVAARAAVVEVEASLANAEREYQRQLGLEARGLTSASALDAARTQAEALRARVESQRESVRVAEQARRAAQVQLDNTIVRAPFSGVVTVKAAQPGEMISPISAGGGSIRTGIGTIVDMDSLEIQVDVSEAYINRVKPGQPVEAVLNAYPDWRIPAEVIAIVPTADRSKATVKVRIALGVKDARIVPEMGVRVSFLEELPGGGEAPKTVALQGALVPLAAIRQEDGENVVYVARDGRAERRRVTLGGTQGDARRVTDGVAPGEQVVVDAPAALRDGSAVAVRRGANP
ncbi:MAG TPA: efflux RND transporter periplasmic adaptor subunit [Steroidobacteraceae bacterium]|nr:efflux RND transporter periplasmic adaptor subunit [Steroidobacteraceae bacterium]